TLTLLRMLRQDRTAILRSYAVPFLLIYAVLILVALTLGAVLARRLARPIESLVASTRQVAAGDLTTRVDVDAQGEVGDLVISFNAMVERLDEQRQELARLERVAAWRDLARTLAHEIKNPLTPILLAVQSAHESYRGDDTAHQQMLTDCEEIVHEEVEGLRCLVKEFSEFARLPQPTPQSGDLGELLGEMERLYGEERVLVELPAAGLEAWFDAGELRRALINLVDNGLAACGEAGAVERVVIVARETTAGMVTITITDQGGGITPENLPRIFEPNFSTKKEGMGLGLPIVEGIIKGHGGRIRARSAPSEGTTFTIELPAKAPAE
ncbi:MAG: ATP-binding protein, partial [bacterium]